ncbi:MAG: Ada metal-binding domain-containing protein [Thermodesulfobacteriota bacterium]
MKRATVIAVSALVILSLFTALALSAEFWASNKSDKYHSPTCQWARKINPANLVKFRSPEEAIKSGFKPCKVCKPPTSSKPER